MYDIINPLNEDPRKMADEFEAEKCYIGFKYGSDFYGDSHDTDVAMIPVEKLTAEEARKGHMISDIEINFIYGSNKFDRVSHDKSCNYDFYAYIVKECLKIEYGNSIAEAFFPREECEDKMNLKKVLKSNFKQYFEEFSFLTTIKIRKIAFAACQYVAYTKKGIFLDSKEKCCEYFEKVRKFIYFNDILTEDIVKDFMNFIKDTSVELFGIIDKMKRISTTVFEPANESGGVSYCPEFGFFEIYEQSGEPVSRKVKQFIEDGVLIAKSPDYGLFRVEKENGKTIVKHENKKLQKQFSLYFCKKGKSKELSEDDFELTTDVHLSWSYGL